MDGIRTEGIAQGGEGLSILECAGETVAIMHVLVWPPSESRWRWVGLDSLREKGQDVLNIKDIVLTDVEHAVTYRPAR